MGAQASQVGIIVRMTPEQREQLKQEAKSLGIPVQALAERRLLGIVDAGPRPLGRVPKHQQELPMTG